ncbi:pilus assembly protein TadG-related protein [Nocardioides sp.]|uniref:pilus assembly protein TadG-related protein n=1 Tax=Nocardioides sp. TaxID=35761 RepID=UPI0035655C76
MSLHGVRRRLEARAQQGGYAALMVAMLAAVVLLPVTAMAVDVARWYVELERVQTAADAAATAGVTYMPDDFASAKATAIEVAGRNGYPNSGNSTVVVEQTTKPSQIKVTVSMTVGNAFGASFGSPFTTVSRSAVADFNGPAPMGSPCNSYGNEPSAAISADTNRGPSGSVIIAPPGGASCSSNPQFWAAIAGPETPKSNGDAYMTRNCSSSSHSGCSGSTNNEFDPLGYFYAVHVDPAAVGVPMTIQIYDPAMVEVGDKCEHGPTTVSGVPFANGMNPYVPSDGSTRYAGGNGSPFCNGDVNNGGVATDIVTSYGLRKPTDTYQPKQGAPITQCQKQYPGYDKNSWKSDVLKSGHANYKLPVAQVFRQWLDLCTYTPTQAGDYYLQIRTNVALGGTSDGQGGYQNNPKVFSQTGDDTSVVGKGNNRFAIRVKGAARGAISVSGYDNMEMYANYAGAVTTFNLVRVIPAAATKTLKIGFFDVGDASAPGTLTILPPSDSNLPASMSNCKGLGTVVTGTLTGCKLTNVSSSTYNGKWQFVSVPIPANYTCTVNQAGGCWFKVKFEFPGSVPNDTTTWTAKIDGDPVRLVQ